MPTRHHARVRDTDRGWERYRSGLARVAEPRVVVGLTAAAGAERHPSGSTVLDAAAAAEFGTRTQPATPFLRSWADDPQTEDELRAAAHLAEADPAKASEVLDRDGARWADRVRARVVDEGLVETGMLRDAIGHEVRS